MECCVQWQPLQHGYLAVHGSGSGPFFKFQDGCPMSRKLFVARVRGALEQAGLQPERLVERSFRIVAATTAAEWGLDDSLIKTLGQ